jgi:nucleoid-associated protein YgaU
MTLASLRAVFVAAQDIPASVAESWGSVSTQLQAGTATRAELQHLAADITGILDDIADARADLDAADAADYVRGAHPAELVAVWQAERETRRQLVRMAKALRDLRASVVQIADGRASALYVSRDGDTLQSIAARHLGDWRSYTDILDANPGLTPGPIASGTLVTIPARR